MKVGKLSHEDLQNLVLNRLPPLPANVLQGPGIGLDCASVRFNDGQVVLSCDPITGAASDIGRLCVHIACNDIAACGVRPSVLMLVLIAPPSCTPDQIVKIVEQASDTAKSLNVAIVGGHTEISDSVNRFVMVATAIGFTYGDSVTNPGGGLAGDTICMTKTAGIEGSVIFARDHREKLSQHLSENQLDAAAALIDSISVIEEGTLGRRMNVHAMHDATEGGILGACWEIAEACGLGCVIDLDQIPVDQLTQQICAALGVDPYRLISSGSLILVTSEPDQLIDEMAQKGILCTPIGRLTECPERLIHQSDVLQPLEPPGPDPLYKID